MATPASFDRARALALFNSRTSDDGFLPRSNHGLFMLQTGGLPTRPTHYLDGEKRILIESISLLI